MSKEYITNRVPMETIRGVKKPDGLRSSTKYLTVFGFGLSFAGIIDLMSLGEKIHNKQIPQSEIDIPVYLGMGGIYIVSGAITIDLFRALRDARESKKFKNQAHRIDPIKVDPDTLPE